MRLLTLRLINFQGFKDYTFEPNGCDVDVRGTNAAGKTSLYSAYTWLLFGKNSIGQTDFAIKPNDRNGESLHNLTTTVEGVFELENGSHLTLRKDYCEKWTKKRGSSEEKLTGHETNHYIDGVPVSKGAYDRRVSEICPADKVRLLTQLNYFAEVLGWKERRKILIDIVGDISDDDIIAQNPNLSDLKHLLLKPGSSGQTYSVEEYQKIAEAQKKSLNKTLDILPARIDEAYRALPDINGLNEYDIKAKITELQAQIKTVNEELSALDVTDTQLMIFKQIGEINAKIAAEKAAFDAKKNKVLTDLKDKLFALKSSYRDKSYMRSMTEKELSDTERKLSATKDLRTNLASEYKTLQEVRYNGSTICPTCNQSLPEKQITTAIEVFNKNKSDKLEALRNQIEKECSKQIIAELEGRIETLNKTKADLAKELVLLLDEITKLETEIESQDSLKYETTQECAAYIAEIERIKSSNAMVNEGIANEKLALRAKISALEHELKQEQQKLLKLATAETQKKRIEELEAEEKRLNKEYESVVKDLYLCEEFIKAKMKALDERINSKFKTLKFRLFRGQINEGIEDVCDILVPSPAGALVPYSEGANKAACMNASLEIIDTLSRHYGISLPVFIDNAESVVEVNKIGPQVIRLIVDGNYKELTIFK